MLQIKISAEQHLTIEHVILDFNGTLAVDGRLLPGVVEKIIELAALVQVHILTADTNFSARSQLLGLPCVLHIIGPDRQDQAKRDYGHGLDLSKVLAVGNGRNDRLLLSEAALGICLIQQEGASTLALQAADIVCLNIKDALELLLHPHRLTASLRN